MSERSVPRGWWLLPVAVVALTGAIGFFVGSRSAPLPAIRAEPTPRALAFLASANGSVLVGGTSGAAARSGTALGSRDQLATDDGARALLLLRGAGSLVVGPRVALQVLDEEWDDRDRLRLTRALLLRGRVRVEAPASPEGSVIESSEGTIEIASQASAFVSLDEQRKLCIAVLRGGALLRQRDGTERVLADREATCVEPDAPPPAVAIRLPGPPPIGSANVRERLYAGETGRADPTFRFPGERGDIQVVVARDNSLRDVVTEGRADADSVRVEEGLAPGTYFWSAARVETVSKLAGPYAGSRTLQVLPGSPPPTADESPATPVVVSGSATRVFYSGGAPPRMGLDWTGLTDDEREYQIAVGRDAKLDRPVVSARSPESRLVLPALADGTYHWRAKSPDGGTQTGRFVIRQVKGYRQEATRSAQVREEFDSAEVLYQRQLPSLEFLWAADARADGYKLLVGKDADVAEVTLERETTGAGLTLAPGELPEGEHFWRVQRRKGGAVFYPGKIQRLRVLFDPESPGVELDEPADGAVVTTRDVRVSGLAPVDSALWVNGAAASPDAQGRFSIRAPIDPEEPMIVVRCARPDHEPSWYVRTLARR